MFLEAKVAFCVAWLMEFCAASMVTLRATTKKTCVPQGPKNANLCNFLKMHFLQILKTLLKSGHNNAAKKGWKFTSYQSVFLTSASAFSFSWCPATTQLYNCNAAVQIHILSNSKKTLGRALSFLLRCFRV